MPSTFPTSPEERAWIRIADHFLDTETRHGLPATALACVEAGFDVGAMEDALYARVAPELERNLLSVAGEWAGWNEARLLRAMRRRPAKLSKLDRVSGALSPFIRGTAESIARFMSLLGVIPPDDRSTTSAALSYLGRIYFEFAPEDPGAQASDMIARLDAPLVGAFVDAIEPVTYPDDRTRGERALARCRAQLANRNAAGIDVRGLFASPETWSTQLGLPFEFPERIGRHLASISAMGTRAYHDLSHVVEVLGHYRSVESWTDPRPVALAILFHDAIYDVQRTDNEERSAELLGNLVRDTNLARFGDRAQELVLLTARHGSMRPGDVDEDAAHFLDCDLAVVGARSERYDAYEAAIAAEYAHVPTSIYRRGRRKFLQNLAARDPIFLTDGFHWTYDAPARNNLRRAIEALHG